MSEKKEITELTEANKQAAPTYVRKWIDVGIDTQRITQKEAEEIIHPIQSQLLNRKETPVILVDNPLLAWIGCHLARDGVPADQIPQGIDDFVSGKKRFQLDQFTMPFLNGSFSNYIFSFYDFMLNEVGVQIDPELERKYKIWEASTQLGIVFPMEEVCFVAQKPTKISFNAENRLHADCDGPALEYAGPFGEKIWALNGTIVPQELAETPSGQLSVDFYNSLTHADQKMEFVRKFGVERMLELGTKLDTYENYDDVWWTKSQYELWDMKVLFANVRYAPHLKMLNQTTGVWHVEAVSPNCRTLKDAINERLGGRNIKILGIS